MELGATKPALIELIFFQCSLQFLRDAAQFYKFNSFIFVN